MVKGQRAGKAVCNPAWSAGDPDVEVKGGQVGHFVAWVTPDCTWAEQTPTKNYGGAENWPFSHRLPNSALLGRADSRNWSGRSGYVTWVHSECLSSKPAGNRRDSNLYNFIKVLFAKDSRMTSDSGEFHIWNYLYHRLSCCTRRASGESDSRSPQPAEVTEECITGEGGNVPQGCWGGGGWQQRKHRGGTEGSFVRQEAAETKTLSLGTHIE